MMLGNVHLVSIGTVTLWNAVTDWLNKGEGIGLIYKSDLKVKISDSGMGKTFEFAVWQINLKNKKPVQLVGIYHPPPSKLHQHTITAFTNEFLDKICRIWCKI